MHPFFLVKSLVKRRRFLTREEEAEILMKMNRLGFSGGSIFLRGWGRVFRAGGARPPTAVMVSFIDDHRGDHGVEPICAVLPISRRPILRIRRVRPGPSCGCRWSSGMRGYESTSGGCGTLPGTRTMALSVRDRFGAYEVTAKIGEGGMMGYASRHTRWPEARQRKGEGRRQLA